MAEPGTPASTSGGRAARFCAGVRHVSRTKYPQSVRLTSWLVLGVIAVSCLIALLTWLQHDNLVLAWAERNTAAGRILATQGLDGLKASKLVPDFVALAIVSVAVF